MGDGHEDRWISGCVAASFSRTKWAMLVFVAMVLAAIADPAQAQLRSGRTERRLYADDLALIEKDKSSNRQADTAAASGGQPSPARASVLERGSQVRSRSEVVNSSGRAGRTTKGATVAPASYSDVILLGEGDTQFIDDPAPLNSSFDHESTVFGFESQGYGSCDDPGCTACGGGANIAPTCTSLACSPCRNPLRSLWCRMSVRAEVPLYWRPSQSPPPLVTSSPTGTDPDLAGQLGQSATSILLGNGSLSEDLQAGVRLTFSTWLGSERRYGLMFRYWNAGDQDDTFNFDSTSFPILARPFLNTSGPGASEQDTQLVAFPGDSVGSLSVAATSSVDGLELTLRRLLYMDRFTRLDWLYGYQYVSIDEGLTVSSNTLVTGNIPALQGTSLAVVDRFQTENDFHGVGYGLMSTRTFACWKMEALFRLGMGNLRRKVNIAGSTTTMSGGTSNTTSQGLLARQTNDRNFVDDTFVVVPEVGINFAYCIRRGLDFNVGYNYLLVPKVGRASQQINDNLAVNLSDPLVGAIDPGFNFDERHYWLTSLGLGLQLRY